MKKIKSVIVLFITVLIFISCVTAPPHKSVYYEEYLSKKYIGSDFAAIDKAILNLEKEDEESINSLITAINQFTNTDWEKIRAVYVWISYNISYNTKARYGNAIALTDAIGTFEERSSVCEGYSNLFLELLSGVGIEAIKISGYAKGASFKEGIDPGGSNHAWNAVNINGEWHLFDSTWGAGYTNNRVFHQDYDEFYFDSNPEDFVFSHFPMDSSFQFLDRPIDRETFFRLPNLKAEFFNNAADYSSEGLIERAVDGETFTTPEIYKCKFNYNIFEIPISSTLKSGENYKFIFESKSRKMILRNGSGDPKIINNLGGLFEFNKAFKKGELILYISDPGGNKFSGVIKYIVE